ncbi:hypothetical protein Suden_1295 [Sulfurimonas denitrificans DSM 1251]|jgi:hypothetical protein|uniref:Uncharacterized protein n=1 Tax=Sulfurimonas denitrificans (strain ATCC 33889 / DSM 1251) TaxID=326298 RepID=Q30R08_SULDN|nr:hypothetical protein [Sulfurimonas denitrificans]ABB44573.1 hypothetical protein Suden_1295 [Sulfurimonas denitrificans DSM 1251]MDD3441757.1 hypothetical protein [Sulfurimonas denitrificans]
MKILLTILTVLSPVLMFATDIRSQELSTQNMQKQNTQITKLAADELSKTLPQTIDKHTKLIKVASNETALIYIFEIDAAPKSDEVIKKEDHSGMKEAVTIGVCRSSKRFLEANITITYIYNSAKSKAELFRFDIDNKSCSNL